MLRGGREAPGAMVEANSGQKACLSITDLQDRTRGHPLRHFCLPPLKIIFLGIEFLTSQGPSLLPPDSSYRPPVAPPSASLSALVNLRVPPPASWTSTLTKTRSPTQRGGLSGPPPNKTWRTLVDPPPTYGASSPEGSIPCRPSRSSEGLPASFHITGPRSSPST